jgi:hypothetical protein
VVGFCKSFNLFDFTVPWQTRIQEGKGAIQNLLNWRKLNQGHAAGEGKIWDPEHFADLV